MIILTTITLASSNNALADDGGCTETWRSCFNVNIKEKTLWNTVLLKKVVASHLFKKFSAHHKPQSLITVFTRARHLYLSQINPVPTLEPYLFRVRFSMSSMPRSYKWFSVKILYAFLFDLVHATCSVHHTRLELITPISTITEASQCTIFSITI